MPKINPFITLFFAIAATNVVLFGWQRADMTALETRIEERFNRIEAGQMELRQRTARIEAGQAELRERMARIEGTVAGALARPDRLAQAPTEEAAAAN